MKIHKNDHYVMMLIFLNADVREEGGLKIRTYAECGQGEGGKYGQKFAVVLYGWELEL